MPGNQYEEVAADIVSAALLREKINSNKLGTFGFLTLTHGRPHLKYGMRALRSHPSLLLIAFLQIAIVYVIAHDIFQIIAIHPNFLFLGSIFLAVQHAYPQWSFVQVGLVSSIPLVLLINMGWGLMAAVFHRKLRAAALLSAVGGLLSYRLASFWYMPKWWFYKGDIRANMSIAGRMLQFLTAYKLASGTTTKQVELAWAKALDKHLMVIMKAYCSYTLHPVIWGMLVIACGVFIKFTLDYYQSEYLNLLYNALFIFNLSLPHISLIGIVCAWITFERFCLGAMTFSILEEETTPLTDTSPRSSGVYMVAFLLLIVFLAIKSVDSNTFQNKTLPSTGVISPDAINSLIFGISSSATVATEGCRLEAFRLEQPESIREAIGGCLMGNLHLIGGKKNAIFTLRGTKGNVLLKAFVRAGDTLDILLSVGEYTGSYDYGDTWYGTDYLFGFSTRHEEVFSFELSPTPFFGRTNLSEEEIYLFQLGMPLDDMKKGRTIVLQSY